MMYIWIVYERKAYYCVCFVTTRIKEGYGFLIQAVLAVLLF